jgi:hypothetical protein
MFKDSDSNENENRVQTIYAEDTAYVEDFRIRPTKVEEDELKMKVGMWIGGGGAVYYLRADVQYGGEEEGQSKRPVVWFDELVINLPFEPKAGDTATAPL